MNAVHPAIMRAGDAPGSGTSSFEQVRMRKNSDSPLLMRFGAHTLWEGSPTFTCAVERCHTGLLAMTAEPPTYPAVRGLGAADSRAAVTHQIFHHGRHHGQYTRAASGSPPQEPP